MSILRYFNKHEGWYDGKRTPFGGGGPSWNPISWVEPIIQGGGDLLASIDPGPSIGEGLASVDKAVNQLPGGWTLPAIITAAVVAPELAPLLAEEGAAAGIEAGVGQDAFWQAIASGSTGSEATGIGLAAQNAGVALTPEMIAYANASPDPIGSINAIAGLTPEEFTSYTQIIGGPTQAASLSAGEDLASLMKSYPDLSEKQLQDILAINYGADPTVSLDAARLAREGYDAATINQVLGYSYNATELAGTGIESFAPESTAGLSAKDVLTNVNRARQLANLLGSAGGAVKAAKIPTQQAWQQQAQQNFAQVSPQQFGGLYEMNKNPFTFQNPLASALAGGSKVPSGLDVSGTPGTALNTGQQNQIYSSLLRSA
jgi:hypothetical protein